MGIFDELDDVQELQKSAYFQKGNYICEIIEVKHFDNGEGPVFVIETNVLATDSTHPDAPTVGSPAAQVWKGNTKIKKTMALGTLKGFICSVLSKKASDFNREQWKNLAERVTEGNAFAGKVVKLNAYMTKTKAGDPFTQHKWMGIATEKDLADFGLNTKNATEDLSI